MLRSLYALEEITFLDSFQICYVDGGLDWRSSYFQNLRKFDMRNLPRDTMNTNADDVGEVLLASPNLRFLGLSVAGESGCANWLLRRLIMFYNSERIKRR